MLLTLSKTIMRFELHLNWLKSLFPYAIPSPEFPYKKCQSVLNTS